MIIGIIGPKLSCNIIKEYLTFLNSTININTYVREKASDAVEVVEKCESQCDAIIFSGDGVYEAVKGNYDIKKPFGVIAKSPSGLSGVFHEMLIQGHQLDHFSLDGVNPHLTKDILSELNLQPSNIYFFTQKIYDEQKCIDWHINLFQEKKIKVALTGFVHIYDYLNSLNYPVFYIPITRSSVRACYDSLINQYALNEAQYAQIAVEILKITDHSENSENYYSKMLKKNDAERFIIEYVQKIQGSINRSWSEYIIFTSKGCVQNEKNYALLQELNKTISSIGFDLNIGIGCGTTAYASEANAQKALARSLKSKDMEAYLIDEYDTLIGPLFEDLKINYSLISNDESILKISEQTELSCESILKIISIIEVRKNNVFDAVELADCLNISVRSARRILNKLIATGYGKLFAKESSSGGGRPKNLIEISFKIL